MAKELTLINKPFMPVETDKYVVKNPSITHQIFKDEVTDAKIKKHLEDEEDEITAEDISNIKTEMTNATEEDFQKAAKKEGFSDDEIDSIRNAEN